MAMRPSLRLTLRLTRQRGQTVSGQETFEDDLIRVPPCDGALIIGAHSPRQHGSAQNAAAEERRGMRKIVDPPGDEIRVGLVEMQKMAQIAAVVVGGLGFRAVKPRHCHDATGAFRASGSQGGNNAGVE